MPAPISRRAVLALASLCLIGAPSRAAGAEARRPRSRRRRRERKAWVNGRGMCVFPFAADELPDTADDFAAAMARGYRRGLKLPEDAPVVVATGGDYPAVESLRIDVCEAVIEPHKDGRKPSERQLAVHGLDAARLEFLGHGMTIEGATLNLGLTATDARLLFTRDREGRPLLVLGGARAGRMSAEVSVADVERLLLAAARKGGKAYGLSVDGARLKMTAEDGRRVRVHLKLSTRVGFVPAGLHFRARLDIDDRLDARLSGLSCTGDEVLGPLVGGLIQPFLDRYNGKTRPLMNFPATDMRLRDVRIDADDVIRVSADFGS